MTNADVRRAMERLEQARAQRRAELATTAAPATAAPATTATTPATGARVFDPLTGEEGEVLGGTRENVVLPAAKG